MKILNTNKEKGEIILKIIKNKTGNFKIPFIKNKNEWYAEMNGIISQLNDFLDLDNSRHVCRGRINFGNDYYEFELFPNGIIKIYNKTKEEKGDFQFKGEENGILYTRLLDLEYFCNKEKT